MESVKAIEEINAARVGLLSPDIVEEDTSDSYFGDDDADEDDELGNDEDGAFASDPKLTPAENLIKSYRQYITVLTEPDEEAEYYENYDAR